MCYRGDAVYLCVCYSGDTVYRCVVEAWCVPVCVIEGDGLAIGDEHHVPIRQVLHAAHRGVEGQRLHRLGCVPVPKSTHTHTHTQKKTLTNMVLPLKSYCWAS